MLVKVVINNFLSIKEEQVIKLNKDVTSIIGKNESGKSTILKAIYKLNGESILKQEKNVNLKNDRTSIEGYFKISKEELKRINDDYSANSEYSFYALPDEYGELYFSKKVDETNNNYYGLYYMGEDKTLKKIDTSLFADRIRKQIELLFDCENETDEVKKFLKDIKKLRDDEIKARIQSLNVDFDLKEDLDSICDEIEKNHWIDLLPKYKFIKFSSFNDVLKDNVFFSEIDKSQQAKNILRIADIDLEELGDAFENNDEQKLEDLQTQYIDIVSKKFKEIFQQTDENFKLKIRFGTSKKEIIFLTQDKTSGNSSINLSQRSDGFKWYLSLYLTLYEYLNKIEDDTNYILLLDEPNLYLHPGAQNNLLFNVFYKEFNDVQIVFTTHSPYMINPDNSFSLRIIEKEKQTIIYNSSREYAEKNKKIKDVDTLSPLLTALELNISNSLIINDKNILITVEGIQDVYLLQAMIKKCKYTSKFENIRFVSGMSAEKVPYMFSYLYGMGYNVFALLDNDKPGRKAIETITNSDETDEIMKRLFMYNLDNHVTQDFLLEDLLSESDKEKYLPNKSTILYKRIFDEVNQLEFDQITLTNFKNFLDALLKRIK